MIPLLQRKTADTAHTGIFVSVTRPLSQFLGGAWGRGYNRHIHIKPQVGSSLNFVCVCEHVAMYTCVYPSLVCVGAHVGVCTRVCANVIQPSLFIVNIEVKKNWEGLRMSLHVFVPSSIFTSQRYSNCDVLTTKCITIIVSLLTYF